MDPQLLKSFKVKQGSIRTVAILDDNSFAVAGTSLGSVLLFPLEKNLRPRQLTGHNDVVTCIEPLPDTHFFLTGSKDGTVRFWREQDSAIFRPNDGSIQTISISVNSSLTPSGNVVFIVGKNGSPSIWDIDKGEEIIRLPNHEQITCGVISHDGAICLTGSADGTCRFFDANSGRMVRSFRASAAVECVSLSENAPLAAAGCKVGDVTLFNFKQNEVEAEAQIHDGPIVSIHFHPIMNLLVTGSVDSKIKICSASSLKIRFTLEGHSKSVRNVKWSNDGEKIISCADDQGVLILTSPGDDLSEIEEEDENSDNLDQTSLSYHVSKTKSTVTGYSDSHSEEEEAPQVAKTEDQIKIEKLRIILGHILDLKKTIFTMDERLSNIDDKIKLIEKAQDEESTFVKKIRK